MTPALTSLAHGAAGAVLIVASALFALQSATALQHFKQDRKARDEDADRLGLINHKEGN